MPGYLREIIADLGSSEDDRNKAADLADNAAILSVGTCKHE